MIQPTRLLKMWMRQTYLEQGKYGIKRWTAGIHFTVSLLLQTVMSQRFCVLHTNNAKNTIFA